MFFDVNNGKLSKIYEIIIFRNLIIGSKGLWFLKEGKDMRFFV